VLTKLGGVSPSLLKNYKLLDLHLQAKRFAYKDDPNASASSSFDRAKFSETIRSFVSHVHEAEPAPLTTTRAHMHVFWHRISRFVKNYLAIELTGWLTLVGETMRDEFPDSFFRQFSGDPHQLLQSEADIHRRRIQLQRRFDVAAACQQELNGLSLGAASTVK